MNKFLFVIYELTEPVFGLPDDDILDQMNSFPCLTTFKFECSIMNE